MRISREAAFKYAEQNWWKLALGLLIAILLLVFLGSTMKVIFVLLIFILLASFSTFYFNYVHFPINFELVKLTTILTAVTYGPIAALFVGILATIMGKTLISRIDEKLVISVGAISLLAIAASVLSETNITTLGIILVGVYNVVLFLLTQLLGGDIGWNLPYEGSNFAINFLLFTAVAPLLIVIIS